MFLILSEQKQEQPHILRDLHLRLYNQICYSYNPYNNYNTNLCYNTFIMKKFMSPQKNIAKLALTNAAGDIAEYAYKLIEKQ